MRECFKGLGGRRKGHRGEENDSSKKEDAKQSIEFISRTTSHNAEHVENNDPHLLTTFNLSTNFPTRDLYHSFNLYARGSQQPWVFWTTFNFLTNFPTHDLSYSFNTHGKGC